MKLIVGLGNPGLKYKYTRHNAGFLAVDFLVEKLDKKAKWKKNKTKLLEYTKLNIRDEEYEFIKPQTFMNNSGRAVKYAWDKHHFSGSHMYIIYDELDLPFGAVRFRTSGSPAGHKGIKSIIQELGTDEFNRVRIGIRNVGPRDKFDIPAEKYVLSKFSKEERKKIKEDIFPMVEKLIFNG